MTPAPDEAVARRAGPADAAELARLRWQWRAVEREEAGDPDRFPGDFARWVAEHDGTHLPFLLEVGGRAVGMAWLAISERIPGPAQWTRLTGDVQSVYVADGCRDRGLGAVLMRALIEEARVRGVRWLAVHPSPRSFPFYRRLGFTGEGSLLFLELSAP
jgi:GNAT superfamily N-acetyltransferase